MEEDKRAEIKVKIEEMWDDFEYKSEIADKIEHDYIFGELGNNEHYRRSDIMLIVNEVNAEKNPAPEVDEE